MKSWKFLCNSLVAPNARVVVFWNPITVNDHLLDFLAQAIHVFISSLKNHYTFIASFVYGFNNIQARRALWEDLRRWSPNSQWLVLDDFNSLLSQKDKHNGAHVTSYKVSDFRECCTDLGLVDLNSTGYFFT